MKSTREKARTEQPSTSTKSNLSSVITSSFSGAAFSWNSKSPLASISARWINFVMKLIDTMLDPRIWIST
eukprot:14282759-Heterocapsa_arctica.AAC.1